MDEYRGQKVLITGGLGFIGSNLAIRLVKSGASVTLLDSMHPTCGGNYFNIESIKNNVEVVEGDSCNLDLVRKAFVIAGLHSRLKGDYFNLAGVGPIRLEEFVKILLKAAVGGSYRIVPFPSDKKAIDVGSVYSSAAKFNAASGWKARISIEEGLPPTLEYYRRHRDHYW